MDKFELVIPEPVRWWAPLDEKVAVYRLRRWWRRHVADEQIRMFGHRQAEGNLIREPIFGNTEWVRL